MTRRTGDWVIAQRYAGQVGMINASYRETSWMWHPNPYSHRTDASSLKIVRVIWHFTGLVVLKP